MYLNTRSFLRLHYYYHPSHWSGVLIICEGPDGSGKSTLVAQLEQTIRRMCPSDVVEILHKGPPNLSPITEYEQPLFSYRPGQKRHIICDRWHLGEWVYPRVLGRPTRADDANLWHIEAFLESRGAVLVYATPDANVISRNITERGDDLVNVLHTTEIISGYQAQIAQTRLPVWRYDYTVSSPAFFSECLIAYAEVRDIGTARLNPFVTYVGPADPQVLLVGDVRHELRNIVGHGLDIGDTVEYGAAFGPERATSGHYLLSHLPSALRRVTGLANSCDVDDISALRAVLGYPRTVALGANAYRTLNNRITGPDAGMPFGAVPHPQYIRRFHHQHGTAYGRLILDVTRTARDATRWRPATPNTLPNTPPTSRRVA